jgi:hypothetical protein
MLHLPKGFLGNSGNERLWREHLHEQVAKWKVLVNFGHARPAWHH